VFEELGARVFSMGIKPDGRNINRRCGSLHPEAMCQAVRRHGADLGIALDGDADRVVMATEQGKLLDGDHLMAIAAAFMTKNRLLRRRTVVATVMSNLGLEHALQEMSIHLVRTPVGDRQVVERMRRGGYNLGGEQSGHLIFLDHATTGDGVLAALMVLAVALRRQKPLSELARVMQRVPQVLLNRPVRRKLPLESLPRTSKCLKNIEKKLGKRGRLLVRYSGTENKVRIMLEGPDEKKLRGWAQEIAQTMESELGAHK